MVNASDPYYAEDNSEYVAPTFVPFHPLTNATFTTRLTRPFRPIAAVL